MRTSTNPAAMQSERDLWAAVLDLAFEDLGNTETGNRTRLWFASDDYEPGSFLWICDHLELDVSAVRRAALESSAARLLGLSGRQTRLQLWTKN